MITTMSASNKKLHEDNYEQFLRKVGAPFTRHFPYLEVGQPKKTQGWILHVSVVIYEGFDLLTNIIPLLLSSNCAFKIPYNGNVHQNLLDGSYGEIKIGKIITIYPDSDIDANRIAKNLVDLTSVYMGPLVPTDAHLGGTVYTRFGSYIPIYLRDMTGKVETYIVDDKGNYVVDEQHVPFRRQCYASWIFNDFPNTRPAKNPKSYMRAYIPFSVIKSDVKGRVMKAINIKQIRKIDWCIIKEGKYGMFSDKFGRTIKHRLEWQQEISTELHGKIHLPEVFCRFNFENHEYLVMEFVEGHSLAEYISSIFGQNLYYQLSFENKTQIFNKLIEVCDILISFLLEGYYHRDITGSNFIVRKEGNIVPIDAELAYSFKKEKPFPPFRLGTEGYMSPEQSKGDDPTAKQDVYGYGALLLASFTNLSPSKFEVGDFRKLRRAIMFLTHCREIADVILACLSLDPNLRPDLKEVKQTLLLAKDNMKPESAAKFQSDSFVTDADFELVTQSCLNASARRLANHSQNLWFSKLQFFRNKVGNDHSEISYDIGFHNGMIGPLFLAAKAKNSGYDIEISREIVKNTLLFLEDQHFGRLKDAPSGLFYGSAGIALALSYKLDEDYYPKEYDYHARLQSCFNKRWDNLSLSTGAAGVGISLLRCENGIDQEMYKSKLEEILHEISGIRRRNGGWNLGLQPFNNRRNTEFGLSKGMTGVLWFLIEYNLKHKSQLHMKFLEDCLKYMMSDAARKGLYTTIRRNPKKMRLSRWLCDGCLGLLYVLIRAYKLTKCEIYKNFCISTLENVDFPFMHFESSWGYGLAGLGETLLEAAVEFENIEFKRCAEWIASYLLYTSNGDNIKYTTWLNGSDNQPYCDFMTGNSGIAHFFLRMAIHQKQKVLLPLI